MRLKAMEAKSKKKGKHGFVTYRNEINRWRLPLVTVRGKISGKNEEQTKDKVVSD